VSPNTAAAVFAFALPVLVAVEAEEGLEIAVGVNTAPAFEMQELAAALAADVEDGANGLTVPFPAKLQASPL